MIIHINSTLVIQVVLFLVFLWILNRVLYGPASAIFRERNARIEAGLRAAEESQRRAEETQREVQQQLGQARVEAQGIIAAASKAAEAQRQTLLAQARGEADALVQQAQTEIQHERQAAVEALRREVASLAVLAASRVIGSSLDTPANHALAERTIAEVGGVT